MPAETVVFGRSQIKYYPQTFTTYDSKPNRFIISNLDHTPEHLRGNHWGQVVVLRADLPDMTDMNARREWRDEWSRQQKEYSELARAQRKVMKLASKHSLKEQRKAQYDYNDAKYRRMLHMHKLELFRYLASITELIQLPETEETPNDC